MQDNLKDHIINSREDFEIHEFDVAQGWAALEPNLRKPTSPKRWIWASGIAASLIVGVSWLLLDFNSPQEQPLYKSEWAEAMGFYEQEIDSKWLLVKSSVKDEQLLADIQLMDQALSELKTDLKDNIDNEEVITAMMRSYRLKLKVLDRILEHLEEQHHETDTTLHL